MTYLYDVSFNVLLPFGISLGLFLLIGLEASVTKLLMFVKGFD